MELITKKNSEYSKGERIVVSIASFIVFSIVGGVIRLFRGPISLESTGQVLLEFLPLMLFTGCTAAVLAYFFPKFFKIILCFIPIPGGSS